MTHKEAAAALVGKHYAIVNNSIDFIKIKTTREERFNMLENIAKQNALITVDRNANMSRLLFANDL